MRNFLKSISYHLASLFTRRHWWPRLLKSDRQWKLRTYQTTYHSPKKNTKKSNNATSKRTQKWFCRALYTHYLCITTVSHASLAPSFSGTRSTMHNSLWTVRRLESLTVKSYWICATTRTLWSTSSQKDLPRSQTLIRVAQTQTGKRARSMSYPSLPWVRCNCAGSWNRSITDLRSSSSTSWTWMTRSASTRQNARK